ncbi:MAG: homocitrate synthase, partial [Firmicutes bacterium]|nr:homocitrate synthase [Bacillota bacterium]
STWNRAREEDLEASAEVGAELVHITLPASDLQLEVKLGWDRARARARLAAVLARARALGQTATVGLEDASRADPAFLVELGRVAADGGAVRLRFADTVGRCTPERLRERMAYLTAAVGLPWEVHAHNDFGLAVANTLAAVAGGVRWVSTTVTGLGERAGNAAMEAVVLALAELYGFTTGVDPKALLPLARLVRRAARRPLAPEQPVVGALVFTHEAGIHVGALLRDPRTYQPFDPGVVGRRHRFWLGKHSGRHGLRRRLAELGLEPPPGLEARLLAAVRGRAQVTKAPLSDRDLRALYREVVEGS